MPVRDLDYLHQRFPSIGSVYKWAQRMLLREKEYPNKSGVWFWKDFILPGFPTKYILSLNEGHTDMFEFPQYFKEEIGLNHLLVKLEGQAPSGSFKDRGMPTAISYARYVKDVRPDLNIRFVACASTGDTSASAATYAAYVRDELRCFVIVAHGKIQPEQVFQVRDAGALVLELEADGFDACMKVNQEYCQRHRDVIIVNSANALRLVGQETISLEIWKDLDFEVPDWICIPIGNAGNATAQMSAWLMLKQLNLISRLPGIILAQTQRANTVVRWIRSQGKEYKPGVAGPTLASAMNIQDPVSFPRIQNLWKNFKVVGYDVSEQCIADTRSQFNRTGVGLCPQGAVAVDAVKQALADGTVKSDDLIVAISTANTLKFTGDGSRYHQNGGSRFANPSHIIPCTLEALEEAVNAAANQMIH